VRGISLYGLLSARAFVEFVSLKPLLESTLLFLISFVAVCGGLPT
jgi:hypothetical protein